MRDTGKDIIEQPVLDQTGNSLRMLRHTAAPLRFEIVTSAIARGAVETLSGQGRRALALAAWDCRPSVNGAAAHVADGEAYGD